MSTNLNIKVLRSSPKEGNLLMEVNTLCSIVMVPKRIPYNKISRSMEWNLEKVNIPKRESKRCFLTNVKIFKCDENSSSSKHSTSFRTNTFSKRFHQQHSRHSTSSKSLKKLILI